MVETVTRKRLEILIDAPLAPRLIAASREAGVKGYTLIPCRSGRGTGGGWSGEDTSDADAKTIFLTIASQETAERLVDLLAPHLDAYGMLLTMSDIQVVRGERF